MLKKIFNRIFSSKNDRTLRNAWKVVKQINDLEKIFKKLSDRELKLKTQEFRALIKRGKNINDLIPEAFAVVREAGKRVFGLRLFDVQLLGGIVLNGNSIAEMRTGEGKTLTATLPAYLNALSEKGVHVVTANDYLAKRDADANFPLFDFLDMTIGINLSSSTTEEKKVAYAADITYGNNNEYGFDYLRDNMVFDIKQKTQRTLHYALVDEVDSILIDEARTPLVISGPVEGDTDIYHKVDSIISYLLPQDKEDSISFKGKGHFSIDRKTKQVSLTERGLDLVENLLKKVSLVKEKKSLYSGKNLILMRYVNAALRAHTLYKKNIDYIVKNDEIIIIDEHTGRTMKGRRWSDGLHQAIEVKEAVTVQNENQTLASITFQNYFRLYKKLAGMTGTAYTEAFEFSSIYNLDTVVIPTNCPMIREDVEDLVYMTEQEKIEAIIEDVKACNKRGQPVLVGTISIEKSELIAQKLTKIGIKHNVLNAKFHANEAEIIAQAGYPSAVTIATNMAGRGTDIVLGGNWKSEISTYNQLMTSEKIKNIKKKWQIRHDKVLFSGGLKVIGTERHESRRIDNQLRGRSGRQGDVGFSQFYLSMEDSLMKIFVSDRICKTIKKLGIRQGEAINHPWITVAVAKAQKKVENYNFDTRKQLLEYDDIANDQRRIIYMQRDEILKNSNIEKIVNHIRNDILKSLVDVHMPSEALEYTWSMPTFQDCLKKDFGIILPVTNWVKKYPKVNRKLFVSRILEHMSTIYNIQTEIVGNIIVRQFEKEIMLHTLDSLWKEHLSAMEYLRQGIHLRGYAQKDPKQEYKRESFLMFSSMLDTLKYEVISTLSKVLAAIPKSFEKKNTVTIDNLHHLFSEVIMNKSKC